MSLSLAPSADGLSAALQINGVTQAVIGPNGISQGAPLSFRNKIINGKMEIAQRGTSFPSIVGVYALDRFAISGLNGAALTASQQADAPPSNEFNYSLRIAVTTADTSIAASDVSVINQRIEGYNVRDLIGRDFTLSFRVRSSKTGTHCVSFRNDGVDRSYVMEYTVNAANTWETKTVTVPGGLITAGTWNWTNGVGLSVTWALAAGTTFQTTANAWQTGNFLTTSSQVNCLDTIGNIFAITGVQLEAGSIATPFEHRPYGTELALCQRYYYRTYDAGAGCGSVHSATECRVVTFFPVVMRSNPSVLEQSGTSADYTVQWTSNTSVCTAIPTFSPATSKSMASTAFNFSASTLTIGQAVSSRINAGGYLGWSAEL